MTSREQVVRAQPHHQGQAVSTLASAFGSDPFFSWLITEQRNPEQRLKRMFETMLKIKLADPTHIIDVVGGGSGVAIWNDVDRWKMGAGDSFRMLPAAVSTYGRRLPLSLKALAMVEKVHPREPHRHLAYIGVSGQQQGSGLGGALLAAATEACDVDNVPAYLENLNPRNTPLYERHGFVSRGLIDLPKGAPPVLAMWRAPR